MGEASIKLITCFSLLLLSFLTSISPPLHSVQSQTRRKKIEEGKKKRDDIVRKRSDARKQRMASSDQAA